MRQVIAMLSALFERPGDVVLAERDAPQPGDDQVLVRLKGALLGPSHLHAYRQGTGFPLTVVCGEVLQAGQSVRGVRVGQDVLGSTRELSEYLCLRADESLVRPRELRLAQALVLPAASRALKAMGMAAPEEALPVAVVGSEPEGLLALLLWLGRRPTVFVDREEGALELARQSGATSVLRAEDVSEPLAGTVFVCSQDPALQALAQHLVMKAGVLVFLSHHEPEEELAFDTTRLHYDQLTVRGCRQTGAHDRRRAAGLLANGQLPVERLLGTACPLAELPRALAELHAGPAVLRCIIEPGSTQ